MNFLTLSSLICLVLFQSPITYCCFLLFQPPKKDAKGAASKQPAKTQKKKEGGGGGKAKKKVRIPQFVDIAWSFLGSSLTLLISFIKN